MTDQGTASSCQGKAKGELGDQGQQPSVRACVRALNGKGTIFNPAAIDSEELPGRTDSERAPALSALCQGQVSHYPHTHTHKEEPLESLQVRVSGTYVSGTVSEIQGFLTCFWSGRRFTEQVDTPLSPDIHNLGVIY